MIRGCGGIMVVLNFFRATAFAALLGCLTPPLTASPQGDLKDSALVKAADLRKQGWPQTRCMIGAHLSNGTVFHSTGDLQPGDRLLYLNNIQVSDKADAEVLAILHALGPDQTVPIRFERAGQQIDKLIQCKNASSLQSAYLTGLDLAGKKKVDQCVLALEPVAKLDPSAAMLRFQCASVSNKSAQYDLTSFAEAVFEPLIVRATYDKSLRRQAVLALREAQGQLQEGTFVRLVGLTKTWPGDETLFEDTRPDWNAFRVNAQAALLASFFDPAAAIVEWPYGFTFGTWKPILQPRISGYWTCGRINGKNRMGGYVGARFFVVVLDHSGTVLYNEVGSGGDYDLLGSQCANSVSMLPAASTQFMQNVTAPPSVANGPSLADDLAKLADLKATGALTEAEYQAAKARILGSAN